MSKLSVLLSLIPVITAVLGQANVILILTDDLDLTLGGMIPMEKTARKVAGEGAAMMNAFTTSPICCPSRTSILTGLYLRSHGVVNNSLDGGCSSGSWQEGLEKKTFAVALKRANYTTFYGGKYLNQYGKTEAGGVNHVPPGWDYWVGLVGNSKYYNYTLSINGTARRYQDEYLTNVLSSFAEDFLVNLNTANPFLMVLAPPAPHQPFTPEPKYKSAFKGKKVPREPHFNFSNNTDKHWLVRMKPSPLPNETLELLDDFYSSRWETLLSVDDLVDKIVEKLREKKIWDNTYVIFTSDNGYHLGQFSMPWDKRQPYESDVRVPFVMSGPRIPKKVVSTSPVLLLDIYPTLLDIAGLPEEPTDGTSILPFELRGNRTFLVEYRGEGGSSIDPSCKSDDKHLSECSSKACCKCQDATNNTYTCVRQMIENASDFLFCRFDDDEGWVEAYDLIRDPYQLVNLYPGIESEQMEYFTKMMNMEKLRTHGRRSSRFEHKVK